MLQAGENIAFGIRQTSPTVVDIDMAVQINYEGPAEDFAWVLPVPAQPCLSTSSDQLFTGLFEATRPSFTFQIENSKSTTCSEEQLLGDPCPNFGGDFDGSTAAPPAEAAPDEGQGAVVLEKGSVGPFDFVIIEAAEGRPESVFEWLDANGYDQPDDAIELITYYADMDMKFVALRLQKDADTGLIRPIVLKYQLPANLASNPIACIPIELTRVAAIENMPIQVYLLGPSRGVAYNYAEMEMDFSLIDYLGCQFTFGGPNSQQDCYLSSLRELIDAAALDVNGHALVTEFAHSVPESNLTNTIAFPVNVNNLVIAKTPSDFLTILSTIGVPSLPLVHTIIEKYIPHRYRDLSSNRRHPPFCGDLDQMPNLYTPNAPWMMGSCLPFLDFNLEDFDPEGLAMELDQEIFEPARDAEEWVLSYDYITRLYGQLDPEQMDKDPLFAFLPDLPDVSKDVNAIGVPVCDATSGANGPVGLDVYIEDLLPDNVDDRTVPTRIDATLSCGQWFGNGPPFTNDGSMSPALSIKTYGFDADISTEESRVLIRDPTSGLFTSGELQNLITVLDDRGPDLTMTSPPGPFDPRRPTTCVEDNNATDSTDDDDSPNIESGVCILTSWSSLASASITVIALMIF